MRLGTLGLRFLSVFIVLLGLLTPRMIFACAVCMGDANSREAGAMNAAIFLMLGFIGGVLGLIVAAGVHLVRKARLSMGPDLAFATSVPVNNQDEEK